MLSDLRQAVRRLRHAPGFTLTAVLTLALGIGSTVAVFTFVDAILFRPLAFDEPERLVALSEVHPATDQDRIGVLPGTFLDWQRRSTSFESLAMVARASFLVTSREPARVTGATVSPAFFATLGVQPALGRTFPADDASFRGHEREIVIAYGMWLRWFGGDPGVLGRSIVVQGAVPLSIVGVMPASFDYPRGAEIWAGQVWDAGAGRGERSRQAIARLRPGVARSAAQAELTVISEQLARAFPATNGGWIPRVDSLASSVVGAAQPPLATMLAAVILVFLIASVNVATLVMQRGVHRRRELAVRAAMGATRWRLTRQSLIEHALLACLGAGSGAIFAMFLVDGLVALAPPAIPRLETVRIDWSVLGYLGGLAAVAVAITSLLPAQQAARLDATAVLRGGSGGSRRAPIGNGLIVAELALAVVLVVGAGLMVRTMIKLQWTDVGFQPDGVSATELILPLARVMDGALEAGKRPAWDQLALLYQGLVERVEQLPNVAGAALVSAPNLGDRDAAWLARPGTGQPRSDGSAQWRPVQRRVITPRYFSVLRLPLLRGRPFTADDHAFEFLRSGRGRRRGVVIVNQEASRRLWPGAEPIGQMLTIDGDSRVDGRLVVGLASDARDLAPDVPPPPILYVPFAESPGFSATLLVRTADGDTAAAAIRARLRGAESTLMIGNSQQLADVYGAALAPRRFIAVVLAAFAMTGLLVAGIGLYGVVAMSVAARTRELAIRIALGASGSGIRRLVVREAAVIVAIGTVVGALGAAAATSLLRNQLVGVSSADTHAWSATMVILAATALTAAWLPARRAARVDPIEALRQE
jgi:putative ABC transport system permease protein